VSTTSADVVVISRDEDPASRCRGEERKQRIAADRIDLRGPCVM